MVTAFIKDTTDKRVGRGTIVWLADCRSVLGGRAAGQAGGQAGGMERFWFRVAIVQCTGGTTAAVYAMCVLYYVRDDWRGTVTVAMTIIFILLAGADWKSVWQRDRRGEEAADDRRKRERARVRGTAADCGQRARRTTVAECERRRSRSAATVTAHLSRQLTAPAG